MFRLYITLLFSCICLSYASAQYHTLNLPRPSPGVQETQTLGITKITIEYSSPAVRGRDVWNEVVPYDGQPIAWRAGANMNTRIQFSTDVTINGVSVPAGSYGLHMIPRKEKDWSLLLAENDQQWGSYYLDIEKDVFKSIEITPGECDHRENLTYEFLDRTDSTLVVALEWEKKSIPFTVGVDLNKTVIESLHSELLGVNTYRWEAWNDAARWCLNRNTNLEEALEWANRSINGGYNGFAADKNLNNLSTKIEILKALRRDEEARTTMAEALDLPIGNAFQANGFGRFLNYQGEFDLAKSFLTKTCKQFDNPWFLELGISIADYFLDDRKTAIKTIEAVLERTPEQYKAQVERIANDMKEGTFKLR